MIWAPVAKAWTNEVRHEVIVNQNFSHEEAMLYHIAVSFVGEMKDYHDKLATYNKSSWLNKIINNPPNPPMPPSIRDYINERFEKLYPIVPCGCSLYERRVCEADEDSCSAKDPKDSELLTGE